MHNNINNLQGIQVYKDALSDIIYSCKNIDGIYDILLRGTSCDWDDVVPYWSDIDLTYILEQTNYETVQKLSSIYRLTQDKYAFKISMTIVSKEDYNNNHHHHGSKPLYYNTILNDAISLYNREYKFKSIEDSYMARYDCYLNLVYLIHELRKRMLTLDNNNKNSFLTHLLKRVKHIVRNSIYFLTGYINEDLNLKLCAVYFPDIDYQFFDLLQNAKYRFAMIHEDSDDTIKLIFDNAETIYEYVLTKIESMGIISENILEEEIIIMTSSDT